MSSRQKVSLQFAQVRVTMGERPAKLVFAGDPWQVSPDLASSEVRNSFLDTWDFLPSAEIKDCRLNISLMESPRPVAGSIIKGLSS